MPAAAAASLPALRGAAAVARRPIATGETVVRRDCPIGGAAVPIVPGSHVRTHDPACDLLPSTLLPPPT